MAADTKYLEPGWFTRNVFNRAVAGLGRIGISLAGSRTLTVRGRKSGQPRTTPVTRSSSTARPTWSPRAGPLNGRATCAWSGRAS